MVHSPAGAGHGATPVVSARDLVKEFHRPKSFPGPFGTLRSLMTRQRTATRAVDGVSFDIHEGELVGYLGPNGAGKSTTIKMLTGILVPTSGRLQVAGLVPWRERKENARRIGVVFGQRTQLWWDLPLIESLRLIGTMYDVPDAVYRRNLDRFTDVLGMAEFLATPVRQLSLGQRMRGDLAAAMLYEPRILYLDEPTVGLDVIAKERMRGFIAELNREEGTTVVLTTHDLADVELLCRRIILIDHGKVLHDGAVEALKSRYAPHRELVVQLAAPAADALAEPAVAVPGVHRIPTERPGELRLRFDPAEVQVAEVMADVLARHQVSDISIVEPELSGVIHQIYERREATAPDGPSVAAAHRE